MYAIISMAGKQFVVKEGDKLEVMHLAKKVGDKIEISDVLALEKDGKLISNRDDLKKCSVVVEVVEEKKGDKICVFKKKKKTGYRKKTGHRDVISVVRVDKILAG